MLITTPGIVLSYISYGDSSIIARIFTEKLGLKTYIVNGVRAKKARGDTGAFSADDAFRSGGVR
ncbi:DNA repair protein RecO [Nitritalea halalkaliphila]|uniref:DNA repair protein RecO n=1 Tax=Nitritalea halalkaliphila TaxID=590849 RepID=UPI0003090E39|nr:recombination protein O N-terminal domain-containing protein [Nitritalea halalkaliphila]